MSESKVLYVPDMARLYGRTESAVRSAVARGADWLPPRLNMRRLAWSRETAMRHLSDLEQKQARKDRSK